jgi:hypothetical protein
VSLALPPLAILLPISSEPTQGLTRWYQSGDPSTAQPPQQCIPPSRPLLRSSKAKLVDNHTTKNTSPSTTSTSRHVSQIQIGIARQPRPRGAALRFLHRHRTSGLASTSTSGTRLTLGRPSSGPTSSRDDINSGDDVGPDRGDESGADADGIHDAEDARKHGSSCSRGRYSHTHYFSKAQRCAHPLHPSDTHKHHPFTHPGRFYTTSHTTHYKFRTFSTKTTGPVRTGATPYPT